MKIVKFRLLQIWVWLLGMLLPVATFAQGDPGCDPLDPACPIDGGLALLLAAGAGYGIKKVRDARKQEREAGSS